MTLTRRALALASILLLALVLRVTHLDSHLRGPLPHPERLESTDMYGFAEWAKRIAEGDWLCRDTYHLYARWMRPVAPLAQFEEWWGGKAIFHQEPLYAYVVAASLALTASVVPVLVLQCLLGVGSVFLVFRITERFSDDAAAPLAAALLTATYAPAIALDALLLREPTIAFVTLLGAEALLRLRASPSGSRGVLTGVILGLGMLLKSTALVLTVLGPLALLGATDRRRATRALSALAIGVIAAHAPLMARNWAVGAPVLSSSTRGPESVLQGNNVYADPGIFQNPPPQLYRAWMERGHGSIRSAMTTAFSTWPEEARAGWVAWHFLRKLVAMAGDFEHPNNENFAFLRHETPFLRYLPTFAWVLGPAIAGVFVLGRRRSLPESWILTAAALASALGMVLTVAHGRYRVPLALLLMVPAGIALARVLAIAKQRRWRQVVALAAPVILFSALSLWAVPPRTLVSANGPIALTREESRLFQVAARLRPEEYVAAARHLLETGRRDQARALALSHSTLLSRTFAAARRGLPARGNAIGLELEAHARDALAEVVREIDSLSTLPPIER